jgi:hypothetical protein
MWGQLSWQALGSFLACGSFAWAQESEPLKTSGLWDSGIKEKDGFIEAAPIISLVQAAL